MVCNTCGEKPKDTAKDSTKAVIEINNPETLVLLRKVVIPVSMGTEDDVPATIGKYRNVILQYEANKHTYLYSSDGIPTLLESDVPQEIWGRVETLEDDLETEIEDREEADTALDDRLTAVEDIAATALQPADIDKVVMTDIDIASNTSTTTVALEGSKENLASGAQTTKNIPFPVASSTEAGIMNSSTFDAVTSNTANINALLNAAVAIPGLSASPSQADLTTAWENETGLTSLINRASIYDVTNQKVWTYYVNDTTWHEASNTVQVTVSQATNSSLGTVMGSTNVGQAFVENDGTLSVNGWDALNAQVASNTSNIAGKQDALTAGSNIDITNNVISADVEYPVNIGAVLSTPSDVAYVDTVNIVDEAVTPAKVGLSSFAAYNQEDTSFTLTTTHQQILAVDVSSIPTGSIFVAIFNVTATGTSTVNTLSARCEYNNVHGHAYHSCTSFAKTVSGSDVFTKAAGADTLQVMAKKDGSTASAAEARSCLCIVIGKDNS